MTALVLINAHARRGSDDMAVMARQLLKDAEVVLTRTLDEARNAMEARLARGPLDLVVAGGGDGTAVSIVNELYHRLPALPTLAVLPLGTGNAWANVTRAPRWRRALKALADKNTRALPTKHFPLVEVEGRLTPFGGCGWDAEIVADYQAQLASSLPGTREANTGLKGYFTSMFTRTIPRLAIERSGRQIRVVNLADVAMRVDEKMHAVPIEGSGPGTVLYEGPLGVAGASTIEEMGRGFRAFPYARCTPDRMGVRVYGAPVLKATLNMPRLWKGVHPLPYSNDWMLTHCRFELDRPVAFEIGGDVLGERTSVEFKVVPSGVHLVDWEKLDA